MLDASSLYVPFDHDEYSSPQYESFLVDPTMGPMAVLGTTCQHGLQFLAQRFELRDTRLKFEQFLVVPACIFHNSIVRIFMKGQGPIRSRELNTYENLYGSMNATVSLRLHYGNRFFFLVYILIFIFAFKRQLVQEWRPHTAVKSSCHFPTAGVADGVAISSAAEIVFIISAIAVSGMDATSERPTVYFCMRRMMRSQASRCLGAPFSVR